jgi:hypothetical protein
MFLPIDNVVGVKVVVILTERIDQRFRHLTEIRD